MSQVAYPWDTIAETPKITRIPPHVLFMGEMKPLRLKFDALQVTMKSNTNSELAEWDFGGSKFHTNNIPSNIA